MLERELDTRILRDLGFIILTAREMIIEALHEPLSPIIDGERFGSDQLAVLEAL